MSARPRERVANAQQRGLFRLRLVGHAFALALILVSRARTVGAAPPPSTGAVQNAVSARPADIAATAISPTEGKKSPAPAATSASTAAAVAATPAPTSAPVNDSAATLDFLGQEIDWYHGLDVEQHFAVQPVGLLYLAEDRRLGLEILQLGFEYARARAELIKAETQERQLSSPAKGQSGPASGALSGLSTLMARYAQVENDLHQAQAHSARLKVELASAPEAQRIELTRQIGIVQSQLQLDQARVDSFKSFIDFDKAAILGGNKPTGLTPQIDALERSIPQLAQSAKSAGAPPEPRRSAGTRGFSDQGLLGAIEGMLRLGRESDALQDRASATRRFAALVEKARAPLVAQLRGLNRRANELAAKGSTGDINAARERKREFDDLIARHKLILGALLPLAKQSVVLQLYVKNLERWGTLVDRRTSAQLRQLIIRLSVLAFLLIVVFVGAMVWRHLTFRYVQDARRRRQLLQLRKLTVAGLVLLVLIIDFASELGALATVMGFAAAGIAFALQNVILSFAAYFFVTGRYGIRVGDRIEIAGVKGDVVEVGLFKMALMELAGGEGMNQLTGRVVVFANSIIFQPNGNFFRPAPGTNFMWNEFKLTLAPECDYRLAEKRLLEVVEDVYARYRDAVQRQYRQIERGLNLEMESPHPQSRLALGRNGIEMTIRYPTDTAHAVEFADEISRRVLDVINKDPALTLSVPGTPNLLPAAAPPQAGTEIVSQAEAAGPAAPGDDAHDGHPGPGPAIAAQPAGIIRRKV